MHRARQSTAGFTLVELIGLLAAGLVLLAVTLPALSAGRTGSGLEVSLNNLYTLGAAQAVYAADWNGRQVTFIDDDISAYGDDPKEAFVAFAGGPDAPEEAVHPPAILGWGVREDTGDVYLFRYRMPPSSTWLNTFAVRPIIFSGALSPYGAFRLPNTRPLHDYTGGRFYDPVFYPPNDPPVYALVEPAFDSPWEYASVPGVDDSLGGIPVWSSYCRSPAAMLHPDVMRAPSDGGWQDPWLIDHGFTTPGLFQARHPGLKTLFVEHHWNQSPPEPCNPVFEPGTYNGCEPYYFNHGIASAPASLFYDLSVRILPNVEPFAADQRLIEQTGEGLWSRDTPFGEDGYLIQYGYDEAPISYHILTTDGILGRDTIPSLDTALTIYGGFSP